MIETQAELDRQITRRFRFTVALVAVCGVLAVGSAVNYEGWSQVIWPLAFMMFGVGEWRNYRRHVALLRTNYDLTQIEQRLEQADHDLARLERQAQDHD